MGLSCSRLYFNKGLPTVEQIRKQFKKQTGLNIKIRADLSLIELPLNNKDVVEKLSQDVDKYESFRKQKSNHDWEERLKESQKINHVICFQFYNVRFYGIDFYIKENTIEIEYGVDCYYFATSLDKALFDLGGRFVNQRNEPEKTKESHRIWKKLKHWDDYRWYNRPKK